MKTNDLLKLSTRMFKARRGRTALTILGMGIGFSAILFLVSLGYGLQNALLNTITSSGALISLDVTPNEQEGKILTQDMAGEISKMEGVEKVEPSYNFGSRIKLGDIVSDAQAVVASANFVDLEGIKAVAGKSLGKNDPKGVLVSSAFAKISGKDPKDLVGTKVSFTLLIPSASGSGSQKNAGQNSIEVQDREIVGVTESDETIFWTAGDGISVPAEIPFAKFKVQCKSTELMGPVKDAISQKGFPVSSLSETVTEVNKLFRIINIVLGLFGIITLVVSAIGMFNTMTVALLERTREIGIMRSIGASRMDIMMMFIIESTLMGFFGGITGVILGVSSGTGVNLLVNTAAKYFGGRTISLFYYPLWFLGFILLFSIVIGFATGIGPAKRASSLDPLEALRTR
jgi:ABC-type antimicrobial peptide transport system permease subunit